MSEEQRKAGLLLRTAAKFLDFILIAAAYEILPKAGYFAGLAYLLLSDGLFEGRSIGKKLLKLKVVSAETNNPCSFKESILRNSTFAAGYILFVLPMIGQIIGWGFILIVCLFEFIIVFGSKDRMRLGDEIAKTVVLEA